jgi:DNA-binding NarL/FixJ family response regulator
LTVETVARRLDMSDRTLRRRVRAIADDLGVDSTIEAIVWAVRHQLI